MICLFLTFYTVWKWITLRISLKLALEEWLTQRIWVQVPLTWTICMNHKQPVVVQTLGTIKPVAVSSFQRGSEGKHVLRFCTTTAQDCKLQLKLIKSEFNHKFSHDSTYWSDKTSQMWLCDGSAFKQGSNQGFIVHLSGFLYFYGFKNIFVKMHNSHGGMCKFGVFL